MISLEKLHTKVYGCSYEHPEVTEAIYSSIRPEDQPGIHILLAYGGDETHIPMKKEDGAGFDYVALGYRHIPRQEPTGLSTERSQRTNRGSIIRRSHWFPVRVVRIFFFHCGFIQAPHRRLWSRKYRMRSHRKEAKISTGSGSRDIGIRNWSLNWRHCAPMEIL